MIRECAISLFIILTVCLPWSSIYFDSKFTIDCGKTQIYLRPQIVGGHTLPPDQYSWLAHLQYQRSDKFGHCGGSVIHSRYVLTAAHCVTGNLVEEVGGLSGVRLGDFSHKPYCDYGTPNCKFYLHFDIEEVRVHENYFQDNTYTMHNDIALIRLVRSINFDNIMTPVCLPFNVKKLPANTIVTVAGWGQTMTPNHTIKKRAVDIPLSHEKCQYKHKTHLCAGCSGEGTCEGKGSCEGDSGGPLMYQFEPHRMVIIGITSQSTRCGDPSYFTDVSFLLSWIVSNVY